VARYLTHSIVKELIQNADDTPADGYQVDAGLLETQSLAKCRRTDKVLRKRKKDDERRRPKQGAAGRPGLKLVGLARPPENATNEELAAFSEAFYQTMKEAIDRSEAPGKNGDQQKD